MPEKGPPPPQPQNHPENKVAKGLARLPSEYQVFWDEREGRGETFQSEITKEPDAAAKLLIFAADLNPNHLNHLNFLNSLLEQNLKKSQEKGSKEIKDTIGLFEAFEKKLDFFRNNYALPLTPEEASSAIVYLGRDPKEAIEAKKLGLELLMIRGSKAANRLLREVTIGSLDITKSKGQKQFVQRWQKECPNLPMPCGTKFDNLKHSDFWYLTQLKEKHIVRGLEGEPSTHHFENNEFLWVDSWIEQDNNAPEAASSHRSKLLKDLFDNDSTSDDVSTVNVSRETIDAALWEGDPAQRKQTSRHTEIIQKLGCNPKEFEIRLIRQDEYARAASARHWGQKSLYTDFDDYFLWFDALFSLHGGNRGSGGTSSVGFSFIGRTENYHAERLVLSPRIITE